MPEGVARAWARSEPCRLALALALSGTLHVGLALAPEQASPGRVFATVKTSGEIRFAAHAPSPPAHPDGAAPSVRVKSPRDIVHDGVGRNRVKFRLSTPAPAGTPGAGAGAGAGGDENLVDLMPKASQVVQGASDQADPSQAAPRDPDRGAGSGVARGDDRAGSGAALPGATRPGLAGSAPIALDSNAPPDYPRAARRAGLEGVVIARVVVSADGRVAEVEIVAGPEIFHEVVRHALLLWRYVPATRGGVPVAAARTIELPFSLR